MHSNPLFTEINQINDDHNIFDPDFELDSAVLVVYAPLGVVPGKEYDSENSIIIDGNS
jgi:hypothetical protein